MHVSCTGTRGVAADSPPTSDKSSPRNRYGLQGRRILAVSLCVLAAFLVTLHSAPVRRLAQRQVTALLAAQQIVLQTDELRYNLFRLSLEGRNVRIGGTRLRDAPTLASIARAQIKLSLPQLLLGRFVVRSSVLDGLEVHYFVDTNGLDNLPHPPADPDEQNQPLDYLIAQLSIPNARVRYENRARQIDVMLPLSSIDVQGSDLTRRHLVRFDAAQGHVRLEDRSATIDRVLGDVDVGEDDLTINRFEMDAVGSRARLVGSIRWIDQPEADLMLRANIDAAGVAPVADVNDPVGGRIAIAATVRGLLASPAVDMNVSGTNLLFESSPAFNSMRPPPTTSPRGALTSPRCTSRRRGAA